MIINLLDKYSTEEQNKLLEIIGRWHIYEYRRSINLYEEYADAPYWGEGKCERGKCDECQHNIYDEYIEDIDCVEYVDEDYHKWFDALINEEELAQMEKMRQQDERQKRIFMEDEEWTALHIDVTLRIMKWLNEKNITYCIVRGLIDIHDEIYVKNFYENSEYRLRFGSPTPYDLKYAVDEMGWKCYDIYDLTNLHGIAQRNVESWIRENRTGIIHKWNSGALLFENEIDAMAVKLKWAEYDEI